MTTSLNEFDTTWAPPNRAVDGNGATHDTIQNAVDNTGDLVLIGPGTFEESVTVATDDITIIGVGEATVIDGGDSHALEISGDGVTAKDFATKTTGGNGNSADAVRIKDNASNPRLRGVSVKDADRHGVHIGVSDNARLVDCDIESSDESGIQIDAGGSSPHVSSVNVENGVGGDGINSAGVVTLIDGAHIDSPGGNGLDISGDDAVVGDVTIQDAGGDGAVFTGENQTMGVARISNSAGQDLNSGGATSFTQTGVTAGDQTSYVRALSEAVSASDDMPMSYEIVDDLEDGDISEYSGDTATFSVESQSWAHEGSNVLKAGDTGGGYDVIHSTFDLENYPQRGDEIVFFARTGDTTAAKSRAGIEFARQSSNGAHYTARVEFDGPNIEVNRGDGTQIQEIDSTDFANAAEDDTWYRVHVDFDTADDGTISATVTNLDTGTDEATASITSTHYDHGGFAWNAENNGAVTYTDFAYLQKKTTRQRAQEESTSVSDTLTTRPGVIDSFEGDLSAWSSTNGVALTSNQAKFGSQSLTHDSDTGNENTTSQAGSGAGSYPQKGDKIEGYARAGDRSSKVQFAYLGDSPGNWFEATINFDDDSLDLARYDPSAYSISNASLSNSLPLDEWVRFEIEVGQHGDHVLTAYDSGDSRIDSVGIVWDFVGGKDDVLIGLDQTTSGNDGPWIDHVEVTDTGIDNGKVVDSFEKVSLFDWTATVGSFSDWSASESDDTQHGHYRLETSTFDQNTRIVSDDDTADFLYLPQAGDTYHVYFQVEADGTEDNWIQIEYGRAGSGHYYSMIRLGDDTFRFRERTNDSDSTVAQTNYDWGGDPTDRWYHLEIQFGSEGSPGDTHTHTLYNADADPETQLAQVSGTPSGSHDGRDIGFFSVSPGVKFIADHLWIE